MTKNSKNYNNCISCKVDSTTSNDVRHRFFAGSVVNLDLKFKTIVIYVVPERRVKDFYIPQSFKEISKETMELYRKLNDYIEAYESYSGVRRHMSNTVSLDGSLHRILIDILDLKEKLGISEPYCRVSFQIAI